MAWNFSRLIYNRSTIPMNVKFSMVCKREISTHCQNFNEDAPNERSKTDSKLTPDSEEGKLPDSAVSMVTIIPGKGMPPEPPTTCCMTGCQNCVWIRYAEELTEYYKDGGELAKHAIDQISDESIKTFIRMALMVP